MKIRVQMPSEGMFVQPKNYRDVFQTARSLLAPIERLGRRAFSTNDRGAWQRAEYLLYHWNIEDLIRTTPVNDYARTVRHILRNQLLSIQEESWRRRLSGQLKSLEDGPMERMLLELQERARAHRINHHPLLQEMALHGLSHEGIRMFLENYYVNNSVFHLHMAALALMAPLSARCEIAQNFYDEMGEGDLSRAHPVLFLRNFEPMGRPDVIDPFPESLDLLNSKIYCALLCGNAAVGLGGFGFLELTMPTQMESILAGLKKSGFEDRELEFWRIHITLDAVHGDGWFDSMTQIIKTPEEAREALFGGLVLLDARASVYDAVWNALCKNADPGLQEFTRLNA
jgi:pyrroloquinoline quinone (PQQ) biosynthesis protein C